MPDRPSPEDLQDLIDGRLSGDRLQEVLAALAEDPELAHHVQRLRADDRALQRAARQRPRRAALAAAALAGFLIGATAGYGLARPLPGPAEAHWNPAPLSAVAAADPAPRTAHRARDHAPALGPLERP